MNGREKRIHKDHTNERKQSQQREENRREEVILIYFGIRRRETGWTEY